MFRSRRLIPNQRRVKLNKEYKLLELEMECSHCLENVATLFKPGVKITLIVRTPNKNERDFLMTDDDIKEVKLLVERRL
jgi:hypothetical protein